MKVNTSVPGRRPSQGHMTSFWGETDIFVIIHPANSMMKHCVLFLFLLVSFAAEAQHLRVGPIFGAQLSRPYYDNPDFYDEYSPQQSLGFNAGGVLNLKASDYVALHTELVYSRVNKHLVGTDGYAINRERFNYLSAPVLLRGTVPIGRLEVYVNAGPSINYWLGGRTFLRHLELIELEIFEFDNRIGFGDDQQGTDEFSGGTFYVTKPNRIQLGLDAGTGVVIPLGDTYLMVDLRYRWGHTNMARRDTEYIDLFLYNDDLSFANQSLMVSCAYLFELDLIKLTRKGKSKVIKGKGK